MKKYILLITISLTAAVLFSQCGNKHPEECNGSGYGKEYPRTEEAISVIDSCMNFMHTDPAKLHSIIDSVGNAKLMSPERCDYYHALVVYEGEGMCDSALAICNRLLDEGRFGDDKYLEEELCVLASNITYILDRYLETLEYANRGIAICHGDKRMSNDEATLMARAGRVEQKLGRTEDAKRTYAEANKLLKEDKTFGGLIARISLMRKQSLLYSETKEYDKAIAVSHEVIRLVEAFHRDPSSVEERPKPMETSGEDTRGFADFYESQLYSSIAENYRRMMEESKSPDTSAYRDSINLYLDKWEQTPGHDTPLNLANAIHELFYAGRQTEFDNAKETVADFFKGDSIVADYMEFLNLLAQDAASHGDLQSSCEYLQRSLVIGDSIRKHETIRMISEQMSIHMVQQEQLARQEAEYKVSYYRMLSIIMVVIFGIILASGSIIAVLRRRNKENKELLQMTQQELIETQEEVNDFFQQFEHPILDKSAKGKQELYDRIVQLLEEKKLYLNPQLNIVMLAEELGTNRTFISTCVNTVTGKTFRTWLAEYRLNLYLKKKEENPDIPIDQLVMQCGYKDQSTFRRQFKAIFGTTPSRYKGTPIILQNRELANDLEDEKEG